MRGKIARSPKLFPSEEKQTNKQQKEKTNKQTTKRKNKRTNIRP